MRTPFEWKPGEHMAVIGRNGTGKSVLISRLMENRRYGIIVKTKPDDVDYTDDWLVVESLERVRRGHYRYILEPPHDRQRIELWKTSEFVWRTGGWTFNLDELFYAIDSLRLNVPEVGAPIDKLLTQGRSKKITMVCGMQRAARITRFAISEATHVICFAVEGREAKIVGEATSKRMEETVQRLGMYEFAWYFAKSRAVFVGKLNLRTGEIDRVDSRLPESVGARR